MRSPTAYWDALTREERLADMAKYMGQDMNGAVMQRVIVQAEGDPLDSISRARNYVFREVWREAHGDTTEWDAGRDPEEVPTDQPAAVGRDAHIAYLEGQVEKERAWLAGAARAIADRFARIADQLADPDVVVQPHMDGGVAVGDANAIRSGTVDFDIACGTLGRLIIDLRAARSFGGVS